MRISSRTESALWATVPSHCLRLVVCLTLVICLTGGCKTTRQTVNTRSLAPASKPTFAELPVATQASFEKDIVLQHGFEDSPSTSTESDVGSGEVVTVAFQPPAPVEPEPPAAPEQYKTPTQELTINAPGRTDRQVYPIDLTAALRFGDANSLEIALARNRLEVACVNEQAAQAQWLPDLIASPNYQYHDGTIQRAVGEIIDTRRNSLFVGGGPVLAWDLADTYYDQLVSHQLVHARSAAVGAARNQALLEIAEAYFDLLAAHAALMVARETTAHAERLAELTQKFAKEGVGLPSDAARARTEYQSRRQLERLAEERTITASAALARRLHLDPRVQLVPTDLRLVPIDVFPTEASLESLVDLAVQHRPEIQEGRFLISAAAERANQARIAPWVPQLQVGYSSGGFGGGFAGDPKGFFNSFSGRQDFGVAAVWQVKNLGFGNQYRTELQELDVTGAQLQWTRLIDKVSEEVVSAQEVIVSQHDQLSSSRSAVESAIESLDKNVQRIREGAGLPIEVLQSIQALERARTEYVRTLTTYNKAQFRLFAATGNAVLDVDVTTREESH